MITGWPDSTQDLPEDLDQYLCFRDELTDSPRRTCNGREQSCNSFKYGAPNRRHDAHHGLTLTLQLVSRALYWPKLQNDITEAVQTYKTRQLTATYGNKKPRIPERQISATRPMEILRMDLVEYQGKRALVTESTTFSGFLAYDILDSKTSEAVTKVLNNILRKFGLAEKINLHNGPCFRSGKFRMNMTR